jgi:large subunit ribosomal protein L24
MKLKVKDKVVIIAGKDKGKIGEILRILKKQDRIVVKGVNIRTKHIKKTQERPGEIVKFEASLHASNAMLVCPETGKRTRVQYRKDKDGKKERISVKGKIPVDTITKVTKK